MSAVAAVLVGSAASAASVGRAESVATLSIDAGLATSLQEGTEPEPFRHGG
jgi:hypothetical protein